MSPAVSINLCCYNSERFLEEILRSIFEQTYKDWELMIINDGSTDSTESIIREYINRGYPIVYHWQENHGLGYSRNEAIKRSRGKYIAFIDHDDLWLPNKLEKQVPLFNDPEVVLVYSDAVYFNTAGAERRRYHGHPCFIGNCFRELLADYNLVMSTAIIRRSALNQQPYWFDERLQFSEEAELFLRLAYNGKLAMVNLPLVRYRVHSASLTWTCDKLFDREVEMILLQYQKLFPDFTNRFAREINQWRNNLAFQKAKRLWISGDGAAARAILKPYLKNIRTLLLYLLSFSPSLIKRLILDRHNVAPQ